MINEKYMVWGTHENPDSKFYALAHSSASKFYFVGEDYNRLKLIQLIMMSSRSSLLVTLSDLPGYTPKLIDNSVCTNWGILSPLGSNTYNGLAAEYKIRTIDALKETNIALSQDEEHLVKNIYLINYILDQTDGFIEQALNGVDHRHNAALIDFFKIILPQDKTIVEMVKFDQSLVTALENDIKNCKDYIIRMLSNIDFSKEHDAVLEKIKTTLRNLTQYNSLSHQRFIRALRNAL